MKRLANWAVLAMFGWAAVSCQSSRAVCHMSLRGFVDSSTYYATFEISVVADSGILQRE